MAFRRPATGDRRPATGGFGGGGAPLGSTASTGSIAKKDFPFASRKAGAARCRHAWPDPGRSEGQCPKLAESRSRPVRLRKAVSRAQLRRRRDPRMPGGDPVHLDLASSRRSRTVGPHRTARQTGDDRLRQRPIIGMKRRFGSRSLSRRSPDAFEL